MKRIFLVYNDRSLRALIGAVLEREEFEVFDFDSPAEALAAAIVTLPDLLITTTHIPGMTGIDLATAVRDEAVPGLPVILFDDNSCSELTAEAGEHDIRYVIRTPDTGFSELLAAVRHELYRDKATETIKSLDGLRELFLVDLSHQLRTPVTAMKLAMDALFWQLRETMNPSQLNLAKVSRRNLERIVTLVENQLDLLHVIAGDRRVCRRLVDLNRLVRSVSERSVRKCVETPENRTRIVVCGTEESVESNRPMYVYADPGLLETIVDSVLGQGPVSSRYTVHLDYDSESRRCRLDVHAEYMPRPAGRPESAAINDGTGPLTTLDFESRAYQSLLEMSGGTVVMEKDDNHKWIRIELPRYPEYDRIKDFDDPVRLMRNGSDGQQHPSNVHFVKCDLEVPVTHDYLDAVDVLDHLMSVVSDGDAIIRSQEHGSVYLALTDRTQDELDDIFGFLADGHCVCGETAGDCDCKNTGPSIWPPRTIVDEQVDVEERVRQIHLVKTD